MNLRFTAILFLVLVLGLGGLLVWLLMEDPARRDLRLLESLAGQTAENVEIVEISRTTPAAEKAVLARVGDGQWEIREGGQGRLIPREVDAFIKTVLNMKPVDAKQLTNDPANHGLDKPSYTVTLRTRDQRTGTLRVGTTTVGGDDAITFVADGDRPDVPLAVESKLIKGLFTETWNAEQGKNASNQKPGPAAESAKWLSDFRLRQFLGIHVPDLVKQATAIKLSTRGLDLNMVRGPNGWMFQKAEPPPPSVELGAVAGALGMTAEMPYPIEGPVDELGDKAAQPSVITGLRPLLATLTTCTAESPADFIENPGPPEEYGLQEKHPRRISISIVNPDGVNEQLLIGNPVVSKDGKPDFQRYYARVPGHKEVIMVFGHRIEPLRKTISNPTSIQERTLLKEDQAAKLDAVDSTANGVTAKLRKVGDYWALYGGPTDPQPASGTIMRLTDLLITPRITLESYPMPDSTFGPANLQSEWKLWSGGLATKAEMMGNAYPAEPAVKGPPTLTLLFAKPVGKTAALRRILADGSKMDFVIPSDLATAASGTRASHMNLTFKSFLPNEVTKLTLNRGDTVYEITRTAKAGSAAGPWVFERPANLKGQPAGAEAVGTDQPGAGVLGAIGTLSAASVVMENPSPDQLKSYGLDPAKPVLAVMLGLADGSTRVYHFGNSTPEGFTYCTLPGKPVVYLVPKAGLEAVINTDLRSPVPFDLNGEEFVKFHLRGWKKKLGKVTTLTVLKKGEQWEAETQPPYLCTSKAAEFLKLLRAPLALRILDAQKPEHGFSHEVEANDPLELVFTRKDGSTLTLTLGNIVPGQAVVYGWASTTNTVYEFPLSAFPGFRDDPDWFKK